MGDLNYSYSVDAALDAVNDGHLTEEGWKEMGCPCIYAEYTTSAGVEGNFVVHMDELEAFAERNLNPGAPDELLETFEAMLEVENYVENAFLSGKYCKTMIAADIDMNRIFSSEDVVMGLIQASKEVTDDDQMAGVLTAGANILGVSEDTVNHLILAEEV